ncbi:ABC transporter substrate-binding protein [Nocardia sp. NPDC019395]|uniref:ABC transporter substrate-binding protein n=1 Tax=Nocardia sp. NPDC019395 TaxID=3154686 RepID=UPI0033EE2294
MMIDRRAGRRSPRRLLAVVCVTALACLAAACGAPDQSGAGDDSGPFVLYASLGMSGASSSFSPGIRAGMAAAVDTINDGGGLLGRPVELQVENNESDPTKAVSLLQGRIRTDPPEVVWAGATSSETLALLSLTTRQKVIALNNGSAPEVGDATTFPYSFSAGVTSQSIADYLAQHLAGKGYKTVGVLTASDAFGEGVRELYANSLEAAGITVVSESYEPDVVEMDGPLARIGSKRPDAVVFSDFVHPTYILKSRIKVGMGDIPFVGDLSTTANDMYGTLTDEERRGVTLATYKIQASAAGDRPGAQALMASLEESGAQITSGLYLYGLAYDTVLAYANAVTAVGSTDVDEVRAAMEAGQGDTYPLAMTDEIGWTEQTHLGSGEDQYAVVPVSPMVAGRFQADR